MGEQYEIPKTETRTSEIQTYSVWLMCLTDTGCAVPQNVIIDAVDEQAAAEAALRFVSTKGISVTLMCGAPPLPAMAVGGVAYRVERTSRIAAAANMPGGRTN